MSRTAGNCVRSRSRSSSTRHPRSADARASWPPNGELANCSIPPLRPWSWRPRRNEPVHAERAAAVAAATGGDRYPAALSVGRGGGLNGLAANSGAFPRRVLVPLCDRDGRPPLTRTLGDERQGPVALGQLIQLGGTEGFHRSDSRSSSSTVMRSPAIARVYPGARTVTAQRLRRRPLIRLTVRLAAPQLQEPCVPHSEFVLPLSVSPRGACRARTGRPTASTASERRIWARTSRSDPCR